MRCFHSQGRRLFNGATRYVLPDVEHQHRIGYGRTLSRYPNIADMLISMSLTLGFHRLAYFKLLNLQSLRGAGASDGMIEGLGEFQELTSLDLSQSTSGDTKKITAEGLEVSFL